MPGTDDLLRLIGDIYDAALEPERWPDVVNRLGDAMRATMPALGIYDLKTQTVSVVAPRNDPDWLRSYFEHWAARNILWQRSASLPVGTLFRFETFLPRDEFDRSDIYNEWFHPQRMDIALTGNILAEGSASGVMSFYRPWKDEHFRPEEEKFAGALLPHLQRAVQLHIRLARLEMQRGSDAAMLNRLEHGALLVDAQARVLFANRAAEAMLADAGGVRLERGRLAARRGADSAALHRTIASASQGGSGGLLVIARDERPPLMLLVVPLRTETGWLAGDRPQAIAFIKDPERPAKLSLLGFAQHFGLTPAQAALSREIVQGDGVAAAAGRLGIAYATARTHLLQIFQKTGTARQTALVRLMLDWNEGSIVD